jgi:hypothetical protein
MSDKKKPDFFIVSKYIEFFSSMTQKSKYRTWILVEKLPAEGDTM